MALDLFEAFSLGVLYSSIESLVGVLFFAILFCSYFAHGLVWAACACPPKVSHFEVATYASNALLFARAPR